MSSISDCQPRPLPLKWATTSGLKRIDTGTFFGAFCGPRRLPNAAITSADKTSLAGLARAKSSAVHSGFSASTTFFRKTIALNLLLCGFAQADSADALSTCAEFGDGECEDIGP